MIELERPVVQLALEQAQVRGELLRAQLLALQAGQPIRQLKGQTRLAVRLRLVEVADGQSQHGAHREERLEDFGLNLFLLG